MIELNRLLLQNPVAEIMRRGRIIHSMGESRHVDQPIRFAPQLKTWAHDFQTMQA